MFDSDGHLVVKYDGSQPEMKLAVVGAGTEFVFRPIGVWVKDAFSAKEYQLTASTFDQDKIQDPSFQFQRDGNLVLYNGDGQVIWETGTGGHAEDKFRLHLTDQAPYMFMTEVSASDEERKIWEAKYATRID